MRIAVVGGGLAGLAITYFLSRLECNVDLYERTAIGAGASGIAAGLLHPHAGAHAKLNWRGLEGLESAVQLIEAAQRYSTEPAITSRAILRPAITEQQLQDYTAAAQQHDHLSWLEQQEVSAVHPAITSHGALSIPSGITVDVDVYLKALWLACADLGASLFEEEVRNLEQLAAYDRIVLTTGSHLHDFEETRHLSLQRIKGHLLRLEWPQELSPLPMSLVSKGYLAMSPDNLSCIIGASFERRFESDDPCMETAKELLLEKVAPFFPEVLSMPVLECYAGVRAAHPQTHLPLAEPIADTTWVFSALGSKGLLYHALYAKELAGKVTQS